MTIRARSRIRLSTTALLLTLLIPACAIARPVAFWPLDEGAGSIAVDLSDYGNDGLLHNVTWVEGLRGSALQFGGTDANSYIEVPDDRALRLDGPFTIQFHWTKTAGGVQIFFRKGRDASRYNYYGYLEGALNFVVTGLDGQTYRASAPAPPDGRRHLAFVYTGDSLEIYVDGLLAGRGEAPAPPLLTDASPLYLGTWGPGYRHSLAGVLEEVCISEGALGPEEFAQELEAARALDRTATTVTHFAPERGGVVLARDGRPAATIVVSAGAGPLQRRPAMDLRRYLRHITGARLPLRDDAEDVAGSLVLVGESRFTRDMGLPGAPLEGDAFIIRAAPGRLVLMGNDAVMAGNESFAFRPGLSKSGTANAVNAFLHDHCGVRWFMPGELGEVVPRQEMLEVPALDVREQPARTYALGAFWNEPSREWAQRLLLGSAVFILHRGGHLWYSLIPEKRYFEKHPDWFILRDGERVGEGNHLCTTNPEMFTEALANLRAMFDEGYEWIEIGQTDGYQRCRCGACEALDDYRDDAGWWVPERPADRIHLFHAALAAEVARSHPDRRLVHISYGPTGEVPRALERLPDNMIVEFTHDPPELLARWGRFHDRFTAYVYWFGLYHRMGFGPKASPAWVAGEFGRLRQAGAEAFYFCGGGECWGAEAPSYYVAVRLLRDPDLAEADLVAEFCRGLFGAAAEPMERYFASLMSIADDYRSARRIPVEPGVPYRGAPDTPADVYTRHFDVALMDRCEALLDEAAAADDDPATQRRIRFFRDGFEYLRLTAIALRRWTEWDKAGDEASLAALRHALREREAFVDEMLARQAASDADLPPVFRASRENLLLGPRGEYGRLWAAANGG